MFYEGYADCVRMCWLRSHVPTLYISIADWVDYWYSSNDIIVNSSVDE